MDTLIGEEIITAKSCEDTLRVRSEKREKVLGSGMLINDTLVMRPRLLKVSHVSSDNRVLPFGWHSNTKGNTRLSEET